MGNNFSRAKTINHWMRKLAYLFTKCWKDPEANQQLSDEYRTSQFHSVLTKSLIGHLGSMFFSAFVAIHFWDSVDHRLILGWIALLWCIAITNLFTWYLYHSGIKERQVSTFQTWVFTLSLGTAAFLYGSMLIFIFDQATTVNRVIVTSIVVAFISTGAWLFANLPQAGFAWIIGISSAVIGGLMITQPDTYNIVVYLLASYTLVLMVSVLQSSYMFLAGLKAQTKIEVQHDIVNMLLSDFETGASDWLWETDENGILRHVSTKLENVLGKPISHLQELSLTQAIIPDLENGASDNHTSLRTLETHMQHGLTFSNVVISSHITGREYWWSLNGKPLHDAKGFITGWRGVGSDITDVKLRDEKLAQQTRDLIRYTKQLKIEKENAEIANIVKTEFLANMSHELRTPMNGIMGLCDLLRRSHLAPEQQEYAEIIFQSGADLTQVLNDILDFSKINAGIQDMAIAPMQIRETIQNIITRLESSAKDKGLKLDLKISPSLPNTVEGSHRYIQQILGNIIENAIKFTPQGYVRVYVDGTETESHLNLRVIVEDTGIGIPADKIDSIFRKFVQVEASMTRKYGGTGLGLAICKGLATAMGGQIYVQSEEGKGSVFTIDLPVLVAKSSMAKPAIIAEPIDAQIPKTSYSHSNSHLDSQPNSQAKLDIYVASYIKHNQERLGALVKSWGFTPIFISSANDDGVDIVRQTSKYSNNTPLILIDYQLSPKNPDDDWYGFAKKVRSDPKVTDTQILVLSSAKDYRKKQTFMALGAINYLHPPVKLDTVLAAIKKAQSVSALPVDTEQRAARA